MDIFSYTMDFDREDLVRQDLVSPSFLFRFSFFRQAETPEPLWGLEWEVPRAELTAKLMHDMLTDRTTLPSRSVEGISENSTLNAFEVASKPGFASAPVVRIYLDVNLTVDGSVAVPVSALPMEEVSAERDGHDSWCAICSEEIGSAVSLPRSYVYHRNRIVERLQLKTSCPLCWYNKLA